MAVAPKEATQRWLNDIVIGLNLCPFAAPVVSNGGVYIEVCDDEIIDDQLAAVLKHLDHLHSSDPDQVETSLLVFSSGLKGFQEFWDFVGFGEDILAEVGLNGVFQIASFHPDYLFEGVAEDDVSHFTNRSPYPMLHVIREERLSAALQRYPNPELIPEKNIKRLQELGKYELMKKLQL